MKNVIIIILLFISSYAIGQNCQAGFVYTFDSLTLETHFYDSSYADTGIVNYFWELAPGHYDFGSNVSTVYSSAGYYNVCLTITAADSCTSTYCDSIYVPADPCSNFNVELDVEYSSADSGWIATAYPTGGEAPFNYFWDNYDYFQNITVFQPGYYCVTVTDSYGCTDTDCFDTDSVGMGCEANFYYTPTYCGLNCYA
ncbi:MAG: hypothetical protein C0594_05610, partial [Marinilabiliales bacterium]